MRLILLLLIAIQTWAIVAVKPREIGGKPGVSGIARGSVETVRGNTEKEVYMAGLDVQYDSNASYLVWMAVRYDYGQASGERNTNKLYGHLRYIHRLIDPLLDGELFVQAQDDEFRSIRNRSLGGMGVRLKALNDKESLGELFLGLGAFYEDIRYSTGIDPSERNWRVNGYFDYSIALGDSALMLGSYYQPRLTYLNDYLISTALRIEVNVYDAVFLGVRLAYDHDERPAVGVRKDDVAQKTYLKIEF